MEFGIFTEFSRRADMSQTTAFDEAMAEVSEAEALGYDTAWLAEIHFQRDRSVLASPLVIAAAIAAMTRRIKIGLAVQILPLSHPLHLAEDVATVDQLSHGRLDFGVGRSGLPDHYRGYNVPYVESRERFLETLAILRKAWTHERFSWSGKYYQFDDVCVMPKPYQKPHPPIRVAATTDETYALVGKLGMPIFLAVRTTPIEHLKKCIGSYHQAWREAGHPGHGDVTLIVPVYVADTARAARDEPRDSMMFFLHSIGEMLATGTTERAADGQRLLTIPYEDVLKEFAVYGTADEVAGRLIELRELLGYSSLALWMNSGGQVPHERVMRSMKLFAERVIPRLA